MTQPNKIYNASVNGKHLVQSFVMPDSTEVLYDILQQTQRKHRIPKICISKLVTRTTFNLITAAYAASNRITWHEQVNENTGQTPT